jgi:ferrous iron transport protein A
MNNQINLDNLTPGSKAVITGIKGASPFKKRLLEMGLVKGETMEKVKLAPLSDPAEYIVTGYHVTLRREEAKDVMVETMTNDEIRMTNQ